MVDEATPPAKGAKKPQGLIGQVFSYLSAGVVTAGLAYITVAVLTRLMTTAEYGVFTLFQAVAALIAPVFSLSFGQATTRFYIDDEEAFPGFLKTVSAFLIFFNSVMLAGAWLLRAPVGAWLGLDGTLVFAGVAVGVLRIPWMLLWKTMVAQLRARRFARLSMLRDLSLMLLTVGGAWATAAQNDPVTGAVLGLLAGSLLVGAAALAWVSVVSRTGTLSSAYLGYALRYGGPLVPATIAGVALNLIDRALIAGLVGAEATGLYSFAYNIGQVMNLGMLAALQAFGPRFLLAQKAGDAAAVGRDWGRLSLGLLAMALGLVVFAREAAFVLGGERFLVALPVVPWAVLGYLLRSHAGMFAQYAIHQKRTELNAAGTIVAAVVNVGLNLWLIPRFGYVAAAWTTAASFGVLVVWNAGAARFVLGETLLPARAWLPSTLVACAALPLLHELLARLDDSVALLVAVKIVVAAGAGALAWWGLLHKPKA
jgi:O-antigen/teichoic acid export membrane protein